jgi:hypothetical protein
VKAIYDLFKFQCLAIGRHYQFDQESTKKALSKSFVDLIIINTVVPIQFAYAKAEESTLQRLIQLLNEVLSEKMPLWISLSPLAYIQ